MTSKSTKIGIGLFILVFVVLDVLFSYSFAPNLMEQRDGRDHHAGVEGLTIRLSPDPILMINQILTVAITVAIFGSMGVALLVVGILDKSCTRPR